MTTKRQGKEDETNRTKKLYSLSVVVAAMMMMAMMTMKRQERKTGQNRTKKLYSLSVVVAAVHLAFPEERR